MQGGLVPKVRPEIAKSLKSLKRMRAAQFGRHIAMTLLLDKKLA
jgi:hypothetical protein